MNLRARPVEARRHPLFHRSETPMKLITDTQRAELLENGANRDADHKPVIKLFNPVGAATWLITDMDPDESDYLHGLADLGMGFPELGGISLSELQSYRGPLGLGIERDLHFRAKAPISVYAEAARAARRIVEQGPELDAAMARHGVARHDVARHEVARIEPQPAAPQSGS